MWKVTAKYPINPINPIKKKVQHHCYKRSTFKCKDCDFVGENEYTMEVHIGKYHSDNFECSICEYTTESVDNLDIHSTTCKIYECDDCSIRMKSLKDLKGAWIHFWKVHRNIFIKEGVCQIFIFSQNVELR